jgi:tetratricopeptide (TPR) repeat protein
MGQYYLSAVTPASENQKHLQKAAELAKAASEGERRFIEAMVVARGPRPAEATEALRKLAEDYPGERVVWMILGQNLSAQGRFDDARAAYEKAAALDATTPRAHVLLGHLHLLKGDYAGARERYTRARPLFAKGTPTTQVSYPIAFTYLYEGRPDDALKVLRASVDEYKASDRFGDLPEVFLWNSIARINLESGRLEEAMKAYEQGFASVPGSRLGEEDKKIWLGRLHHGRGRTLARMGRHAEAWQEAETIKKMIDEGGDRGKRFLPAWHYIAGYLKLEARDYAAAVEHLKQADLEDPFHKLLLARAQEKTGNTAEAKRLYGEIVSSTQNNLERALAYPEAKKRLESL